MNLKLYIPILFFALLVAKQKSLCQNLNITIEHFGIDDGLSQSLINCIIQDSKGFIWIGTQDGLNKYNGYSFKVFRHEPLDSNSLSSNNIQAIYEDPEGYIWIGTQYGLNRFDRETGNFKRYYKRVDGKIIGNANDINSIFVDETGFVWAKTLGALHKLNPATGKFKTYSHNPDYFNINSQLAITKDSRDVLWVGSNVGLYYLNEEYDELVRYQYHSDNPQSISHNEIRAICEDGDGTLWIGTGNGLNSFDKKTKTFKRYYYAVNSKKFSRENTINSICEDHRQRIWLGTNNGLSYFDKTDSVIKKLNYSNCYNNVKIENSISSIIEDQSNILWLGTWDGLFKLDQKGMKFKLYRSSTLNNRGVDFASNNIRSVMVEDNDIIWLGFRDQGLDIYNRKENRIIAHYSAQNPKHNLPGNMVETIFKDKQGRIWVGTNSGIRIFNRENRKFEEVSRRFPKFKSDNVFNYKRIYTIIQDKLDNYWFGTLHGLYRYSPTDNTFVSFTSLPNDTSSLTSNKVYSLLEDDEGYIWVGTISGLNRYNPLENNFKQFKRDINEDKGLSHNSVLSLCQSQNGNIWIGTESGLNKYDKETGQIVFYTQSDGLNNDYIYAIIEDNRQHLWLSTNKGLIEFIPKTEEVINYGLQDGLQDYEYNTGAACKSENGELFFAGISGLNAFYPDSIKRNEFIPKVIITSIELFGKEGKQQIFVEGKDYFHFSHDQYNFRIEFAALEFTHPEKNNYKYMMEGLKDEWINIGNNNFAVFPNIPPGSYFFHVKGSNSDLVWSQESETIRIVVDAPPWKTNWAYTAYFLLTLGFIYLLIMYITKNLRKSNQILKEKEKAAKKISRQKEELSIKNKNITDSINYAKTIIESMMPSIQFFYQILPKSFVLYMPKDIVSGDFYWIEKRHNKIFVAAVDCTGHGVPGALMSIIGFDLLRNIINEQGIEQPAEILNKMNEGVAKTFAKEENQDTLRDGMDMAFCVINENNNTLEYAGAYNPLYLIRENNITEIKADRFSVGLAENDDNKPFSGHTIKLQKDDVFYIFSDGFADQFGGPKGKKFKYRRFRRLLLTINKYPMQEQKKSLRNSIESWKGELEQVDDILLIGLKPELEYHSQQHKSKTLELQENTFSYNPKQA